MGDFMAKKIGKGTYAFEKGAYLIGYGSVVGKKEGQGPYGNYFDFIGEDAYFGEKTFEKAENILRKL